MTKHVVAAAGTAVAVSLLAPAALVEASYAHADTGMDGFLRCVNNAGVPPRQNPEDWFSTIQIIEWHLNNGESATQVTQRLAAMKVKPNDAAAEVQCVMANVW